MMRDPKCETCSDTGWYGDNGPGIKGNSEYCRCEYCGVTQEKSDAYEANVFASKDREITRLRELNADMLAMLREYHCATPDDEGRLTVMVLPKLRERLAALIRNADGGE